MESYLMLCRSIEDSPTSEVGGYSVFSSLSSRFTEKDVPDLFSHDDSGLRPISVSRLYRMPEEKNDISAFFGTDDKPLRRGDMFGFRVAFLREGLSRPFFDHFGEKPLFLGKGRFFQPMEVLGPGFHPLCRKTSPDELRNSGFNAFRLSFLSPTGFSRNGLQIPVPIPELVFKSLLKKWQSFVSSGEWNGVESSFGSVRMEKFSLQSQPVWLKKQSVFRGCLGYCEYSFHHLDSEVRRAVSALSLFSFFGGVGYKTAQGMGQVFPEALG